MRTLLENLNATIEYWDRLCEDGFYSLVPSGWTYVYYQRVAQALESLCGKNPDWDLLPKCQLRYY